MMLSPREIDKLYIFMTAEIARRRQSRGLKLNYPEAVAIIADHIVEGARDGKSVSELMSSGRKVISRNDVLAGVPELVKTVQVEATFDDGTKLVTVHDPITWLNMIPGEYYLSREPVIANAYKKILKIKVSNTGDRPIQVGSHTHFFEVNKALAFAREKAYGYHLNIPAGTSIRFEPGDTREIELTEYGGRKIVYGFSGLVNGKLSVKKRNALKIAKENGFKDTI